MNVEFDRDKILEQFCYGMSQGDKLANLGIHKIKNLYQAGMHIEAMRVTILRIISQFPEDFQTDLMEAFEAQQNEGGNKP